MEKTLGFCLIDTCIPSGCSQIFCDVRIWKSKTMNVIDQNLFDKITKI